MVSRVLVLASIFALFLASSLPATAGTFTYFCDRHQSMRGEIRVK